MKKSTLTLTWGRPRRKERARQPRSNPCHIDTTACYSRTNMEAARVLVVDDERSILQLLNEALTLWGYKVTTAPTGRDALEALRTGVFHVAMTDIRMPDMSGLDLLRQIKTLDESIEVVVMTGYPAISSAVEALKEG